jgi:hypothetical protein
MNPLVEEINMEHQLDGIIDEPPRIEPQLPRQFEDNDEKARGAGIIDYTKKIIFGRKDYSPSAKKTLHEYGNEKITGIVIARHPLMSALTWVANRLTTADKPYDKLFHLYMIINTAKGDVLVEKNEVIHIVPVRSWNHNDEHMRLHQFPHIPINTFLNNARQRMGDSKYFEYSASYNNCQDYILNLLQANHISVGIDFIKQDTQSIFERHPDLRKGVNTLTDVAGRLDVVRQGNGVHVKESVECCKLG